MTEVTEVTEVTEDLHREGTQHVYTHNSMHSITKSIRTTKVLGLTPKGPQVRLSKCPRQQ